MARTRKPRRTPRAPSFAVQQVIGSFWRDPRRLVMGRTVLVGNKTLCGDIRTFTGDGSKPGSGGLCLSSAHLVELRALVDALIAATAAESSGTGPDKKAGTGR